MSLLAELQSLACLVSQRPEVTVHLARETSDPWAFNWSTAQIQVNPADYRLRPPDFNRGLLLHESAHAAISRYHSILPEALLADATVMLLMNTLEDCRIENWLQQRLPGCSPWIALYNNHCFGEILADQNHQLRDQAAPAFLLGLLSRWWFSKLPEHTHPLAVAALDEVWPFVMEAVACFPQGSAQSTDAEAIRSAYLAHPASLCHAVQQHAQHDSEMAAPDVLEMQSRMTQYQMWTLVENHILPVFRRLLCASGEEESFNQWAQQQQRSQATRVLNDATEPAAQGKLPQQGQSATDRFRGRGALYAEAVRQQRQTIAQLRDQLLRYLTAEVRLKMVRGQPSGPRLDLRTAMQFAADPRQHTRLWQRQKLPQRPDPHFLLLVDVSGSMHGERALATFQTLVMLREVCLSTGIALSIMTFGSQAEVVQHWENPTAVGIPARLEVAARPSDGGTDLCAGLTLAAELLETSPYRDNTLWVLSDGVPNDAMRAKQQVRQLRSHGPRIVGLGLGPDTAPLSTLIGDAFTDLRPAQLPKLISRLFRSQVCHY